MSAPLSKPMREALVSVYRGWRFGVDHRTIRGLVSRGLVFVQRVETSGGKIFDLPYLTDGALWVAAELHEAELTAAKPREHRSGFRVIDGGRCG